MDIKCFFNQKSPKLAGEGSSDLTLGESPGCRSSQDSDSTPDSGAEASRSSCQGLKQGSSYVKSPGDLGVEKPNQVILKKLSWTCFLRVSVKIKAPSTFINVSIVILLFC